MNTEHGCATKENGESASTASGQCCGGNDESKTRNFQILVESVSGSCNAGEEWSISGLEEKRIPVLSCEGPCVKGEIARRAAGLLPERDPRFKRACHGEAFFVPRSSMARWVKNSPSVVMIDGCFLSCHGRVLSNLVSSKSLIRLNAHAIHKQHGDDFATIKVPDSDLNDLAVQVAEAVLSKMAADPEGLNQSGEKNRGGCAG